MPNPMQTASVLVAIGGDLGNTIPKHNVTASEIAVLRAIHGEGAVSEIKPTGTIDRSNAEERNRLLTRYGRAKDSENNSIVANLFPGAAARMFASIDELGIDEHFFKAAGRVSAEPVEEPATEEQPAPKKAATKKARAKKAAPVEEPEGEADEKDDQVGDMADGKSGDSLFK